MDGQGTGTVFVHLRSRHNIKRIDGFNLRVTQQQLLQSSGHSHSQSQTVPDPLHIHFHFPHLSKVTTVRALSAAIPQIPHFATDSAPSPSSPSPVLFPPPQTETSPPSTRAIGAPPRQSHSRRTAQMKRQIMPTANSSTHSILSDSLKASNSSNAKPSPSVDRDGQTPIQSSRALWADPSSAEAAPRSFVDIMGRARTSAHSPSAQPRNARTYRHFGHFRRYRRDRCDRRYFA